jgi:hypothetical protein
MKKFIGSILICILTLLCTVSAMEAATENMNIVTGDIKGPTVTTPAVMVTPAATSPAIPENPQAEPTQEGMKVISTGRGSMNLGYLRTLSLGADPAYISSPDDKYSTVLIYCPLNIVKHNDTYLANTDFYYGNTGHPLAREIDDYAYTDLYFAQTFPVEHGQSLTFVFDRYDTNTYIEPYVDKAIARSVHYHTYTQSVTWGFKYAFKMNPSLTAGAQLNALNGSCSFGQFEKDGQGIPFGYELTAMDNTGFIGKLGLDQRIDRDRFALTYQFPARFTGEYTSVETGTPGTTGFYKQKYEGVYEHWSPGVIGASYTKAFSRDLSAFLAADFSQPMIMESELYDQNIRSNDVYGLIDIKPFTTWAIGSNVGFNKHLSCTGLVSFTRAKDSRSSLTDFFLASHAGPSYSDNMQNSLFDETKLDINCVFNTIFNWPVDLTIGLNKLVQEWYYESSQKYIRNDYRLYVGTNLTF